MSLESDFEKGEEFFTNSIRFEACEDVAPECPKQFHYDDVEDEADETVDNFDLNEEIRPKKYPFKLKQNDNGNILTVHHTRKDNGTLLRIRLGVGCFDEQCVQLVAIDKRGAIFVFDIANRHYWRLTALALKASVIKAHLKLPNQYLIGTKLGQLMAIDVAKDRILKLAVISSGFIKEISFPQQALRPSNLALIQSGPDAVLVNLKTFKATHTLDFDKVNVSLKFVCYLPYSDQIFTLFTNDIIYVWSGITFNNLSIAYPIRARDRKLRLMSPGCDLQEFSILPQDNDNFVLNCQPKIFSDGLILSYSFSTDGRLCLSTVDGYLLLLNSFTYELQQIFHLRDFVINECIFLQRSKETHILALTSAGQVVLLDCQNTNFKLMVQPENACHMWTTKNSKLLAVANVTGEIEIYSTCVLYSQLRSHEECMQVLRAAFKQSKPIALGNIDECAEADIKKLLQPNRLLAILKEFGCYPAKYRSLIWSTLLKLPCNIQQYQLLARMNTPAVIKQRAQRIKLKNETLKRALIKNWSCLAYWCKVFGYAEFIPHLIFPFVKFSAKNGLYSFEVCVTLLLNHFQLWFEFHPCPPNNYLGMCSNVLQCYDAKLYQFYVKNFIEPKHYAWPLLSSAFSEILDEEQWLCVWDNIVSNPPYFPIFIAVAYSMLQRDVIFLLPDQYEICQYFYEQNPIDVCKLLCKARKLMEKCPDAIHPKRYIKDFKPIPKNVYPKFLNYPKQLINQYEDDVISLHKEHHAIDARIRQLELEEMKMMEALQERLKEEEHKKRMKEMEKAYQDILKREEERIICQRKVLLLYQKEIRNRKGEIMATLQESERRKKALEMDLELQALKRCVERERSRNDTKMILAEDELRNKDFEELAVKSLMNIREPTLRERFNDDLKRLRKEKKLLDEAFAESFEERTSTNIKSQTSSLSSMEKELDEIQREFKCIMEER